MKRLQNPLAATLISLVLALTTASCGDGPSGPDECQHPANKPWGPFLSCGEHRHEGDPAIATHGLDSPHYEFQFKNDSDLDLAFACTADEGGDYKQSSDIQCFIQDYRVAPGGELTTIWRLAEGGTGILERGMVLMGTSKLSSCLGGVSHTMNTAASVSLTGTKLSCPEFPADCDKNPVEEKLFQLLDWDKHCLSDSPELENIFNCNSSQRRWDYTEDDIVEPITTSTLCHPSDFDKPAWYASATVTLIIDLLQNFIENQEQAG